MNKEEILKAELNGEELDFFTHESSFNNIFDCMDIWADQQCAAKDAEIARLKEQLYPFTENTWYDEKYVDELIRTAGNAQDHLIAEIERLKGEIQKLKFPKDTGDVAKYYET